MDILSAHRIHMIGIGGISMSGIAEVLLREGHRITGSDLKTSNLLDRLAQHGATIFLGHRSENVDGAEAVIYTAAVKPDNPELLRAREKGLPVYSRAEVLGRLMERAQYGIAIAGTHGKTTTTSMVSTILIHAGKDPMVLVGGELDEIGGNVRVGQSQYFITEACEYSESFLRFNPYAAAVLNMEPDHLDYYGTFERVLEAFGRFASRVNREGFLVLNGEDPNWRLVAARARSRVVTFALKGEADWRAQNVAFDKGYPSFELVGQGRNLGRVSLKVPGAHNVANALAAAALVVGLGLGPEETREGLESFAGTHRRFEKKASQAGITVVDDYAHHPTEIRATLAAARKLAEGRLIAIFQPHLYSRTKDLLAGFADSLAEADIVILTSIYAAREKDTGEISGADLAKAVGRRHPATYYRAVKEEIPALVLSLARPGDLVITLGAGDIDRVAVEIADRLSELGDR
ncbi:MAG: UDP-N-acetylmuramate--L-alanine ligase [Firmicutes bacterium]|nr:UDP-N-acetylmuramate--L-alanine ligase [Bacillota bacterium]MCL5040158.1 UDP-N-acetylmuramate--L-alanine ligase [Bacillota bacterium]